MYSYFFLHLKLLNWVVNVFLVLQSKLCHSKLWCMWFCMCCDMWYYPLQFFCFHYSFLLDVFLGEVIIFSYCLYVCFPSPNCCASQCILSIWVFISESILNTVDFYYTLTFFPSFFLRDRPREKDREIKIFTTRLMIFS